jgi:hypothetical protein
MITAHADVVGSLLRPPWLLGAQERLFAGKITQPAYKSIEDRAVDEAVAQQPRAYGAYGHRAPPLQTFPAMREVAWGTLQVKAARLARVGQHLHAM